jgi:hypothetical protein
VSLTAGVRPHLLHEVTSADESKSHIIIALIVVCSVGGFSPLGVESS